MHTEFNTKHPSIFLSCSSTTMAPSYFTSLFFIIILSFCFSPPVTAFFHPRDVLPLLPRQISNPILYSLNDIGDLLPEYMGSPTNIPLEWRGACFYKSIAFMEFHNKTGTEFGGGTLHIEVDDARSWTCLDLYVFATPYRVQWDYFFRHGKHTVEFEEWEGENEFEYMKNTGTSIFLMKAGLLGTIKALWKIFPLFTNTNWGENANIDFLKETMGASFEPRPDSLHFNNLNVDDIHSGDFLALSKIRGRWGAFETLEKWVTGAFAGHSAVCLRDPDGKLWVAESGHVNEQGEDVIVVMTWDEWWDFELNKDKSSPHIALLPLHPDVRSKFNESAAWEYAQSMAGKPYGYHNVIFSWIDTLDGNYPAPLDAHLFACFMTLWYHLKPAYAATIFSEALNKRLGTQGLTLSEIIMESEKRGSSFGDLLAIPEQDDWVYADGKSRSCIAYVIEMYKKAGLFDSIGNSVQATEFTIKSGYTLKLFEDNSSHLPPWCNEGDTVKMPYCQILGKYRMELPLYNTVRPYVRMSERCPSLAPAYPQPSDC